MHVCVGAYIHACVCMRACVHACVELGVIGGLITPVHFLMLSLSLPVYQVRLDWLPLPCIALIRLFFIFHGKRDAQVSYIALL